MFIWLLALLSVSHASNCKTEVFQVAKTQIKKIRYTKSNVCSISFSPRDTMDMKYRVHILSDEGIYLVFNSFSGGVPQTETGARSYFLFPRASSIEVSEVDSKGWEVTQPGQQLLFDVEKTRPLSSKYFDVHVDPSIHKKNQGGVELLPKNSSHLVLDSGFEFGKPSFENKNGISHFVDYRGRRCRVKNSRIFNYIYKDGYLDEVELAMRTGFDSNGAGLEKELLRFLKRNCPRLNFKPNKNK